MNILEFYTDEEKIAYHHEYINCSICDFSGSRCYHTCIKETIVKEHKRPNKTKKGTHYVTEHVRVIKRKTKDR